MILRRVSWRVGSTWMEMTQSHIKHRAPQFICIEHTISARSNWQDMAAGVLLHGSAFALVSTSSSASRPRHWGTCSRSAYLIFIPTSYGLQCRATCGLTREASSRRLMELETLPFGLLLWIREGRRMKDTEGRGTRSQLFYKLPGLLPTGLDASFMILNATQAPP